MERNKRATINAKSWFQAGAAFWAAFVVSACSAVPVRTNAERGVFDRPSYEANQPSFFWGLAPASEPVNVREVCLGKSADRVSARYDFNDVLGWVFTLGIYSPRTAEVWCEL